MPQDDPTSDKELNASIALRELLHDLSRARVSYRKLAESIHPRWAWTDEAIKKLANRKTTLRKSPKNDALIEAIAAIVSSKVEAKQISAKAHEKLERALELRHSVQPLVQKELDGITKEIGQRFQSIRKASALFEYPQRSAFVRWDWERRRLVTVLIETKKGSMGHVFVMRISGNNTKRVVLGDILVTLRNTYFSGLAYEVSNEISQSEFIGRDAFDLAKMKEILGPNEIGLECFTVSNQNLHQRVAPVCFHGLDGRGNPISGIGLHIKEMEFSNFGIDPMHFSAVECSKHNQELTNFMLKVGAITIGPSTVSTFDNKAIVGTLPNVAFNGWAILRSKIEGETDVLFSQSNSVH